MPSLVESLGAQLRAIGADLPLAELHRAADRLRTATASCDEVMHESGHADWLAALTAAGEHLDSAIAATTSVLDGLDDYLTGIGLAGVPPADPTARARPARPARGGAERDDPALAMRFWWVERVDLISDRPPAEERPATVRGEGADARVAPEEPVDALRRLARAARSAGPDGYREQLLATHPASGLQVAGPATRAMRYLARDLLGHSPGPDDERVLAQRCHPTRVRGLLPAVDDTLAAALLGEVCGAASPGAAHHPVDAAASWPILTAELLAALGRDDAALPALTSVAGQQDDDTVRRDGR